MRHNGAIYGQIAPFVHFVTVVKFIFVQNQRLEVQKLEVRGLLKGNSRKANDLKYIIRIHRVFTIELQIL